MARSTFTLRLVVASKMEFPESAATLKVNAL